MPEAVVPKAQRFFVIMHHESWPALHFYNCGAKEEAMQLIIDTLQQSNPEITDEIDIHVIEGTQFDVSKPHRSTMLCVEGGSYVLNNGKLVPLATPEPEPAKG